MTTPRERDPLFDAWYALYPRKVARKAAERAWAKLAPDTALVEQIMAALRAQLPAMHDRKFIPYPATWLNQRRFEDEQESCNKITQSRPRVIACEKCGDTGVVFSDGNIEGYGDHAVLMGLTRCSCAIGLLPGILTGPIHAEDAL